MKLLKYFALVFVLRCLLTCAQERGKASKIEDIPYMVTIYTKQSCYELNYHCAGALISMKMAVTSARCVHKLDKEIAVVAGSDKLYGKENVRKVGTIFMPMAYSSKRGYMDIAVLEVEIPFNQGPTIDKIPLCLGELPEGKVVMVSGWGEAKVYKTENKVLRTSFMRKRPRVECKDRFKAKKITVEESMMCAGGHEVGAHFGGSGAPGDVNGQLCAIALSKHGKLPHLYTDLSNAIVQHFLQSTTNGNCCSKRFGGKYVTKFLC